MPLRTRLVSMLLTAATYDPGALSNSKTFNDDFDFFVGDGTSASSRPSLEHDIDTDGFRGNIACRYLPHRIHKYK